MFPSLFVAFLIGQSDGAAEGQFIFRDGAWRYDGRTFDKRLYRDPDYMVGSVRFQGPSYWVFVERSSFPKAEAKPGDLPATKPKSAPEVPLPERLPETWSQPSPQPPAPPPSPPAPPVERIFSWRGAI